MKQLLKYSFVLLACLVGYTAQAQISQGGTPYTFNHTVLQSKSAVQSINLNKPDLEVIHAEDIINDSRSEYRAGINLPVNLNVSNSGTWYNLPEGGRIWRLKIKSNDALALGLYYNDFFIPEGGEVFIYNDAQNHVIGAFTSANNVGNTIRATQMIAGDECYVEYYEAPGTIGLPIIEISEVVYFYRGIDDFIGPLTGDNTPIEKTTDGSCHVDVACTPESTGWSGQIDATVHYSFPSGGGTAVCSASMINNTSLDCTPYILSAWHCGEPTTSTNISQWVWYYNYQKTTCSTGSGNFTAISRGSDTMTGGTVKASSGNGTLNNPPGTNQLAGSDFYLVELNSEPPTSYNAYYAGWDRNNTAATSGVGIHHPAGSSKKISTYTSSLFHSTYNGGASSAHWGVTWDGTTNGHGVTEGGSSGSPIFNQVGRIVGQLSGGSSYCENVQSGGQTQSDLYGKFYTDWDQCGTSAQAQLAPWLDPGNTGATTLDGTYQPCNTTNPPTCNINASATTVTQGGSSSFSDGSTGNPTQWDWDFDLTTNGGATPSTSSVQNPGTVSFGNIGTYTVELTVTNANGSTTCTSDISVIASQGCDTLLNITDTDTLTIYGDGATGFASGWNQYGDLAKVEKYTGYSPNTHVNGAAVYMYGVTDGGNSATIDLVVYDDNAGSPGTLLDNSTYNLSDISTALAGNSGQGILNLLFDAPVDISTGTFYIGIQFNGFGTGDELGIINNSVLDPTANTAFEQWGDNSWHDMETAWYGAGFPWSLYISPYVTDLPVSGTASSDVSTTCEGGTINYSSTSTNSTGQTWYFNGGTPATSTNANEAVTYATAGSYTTFVVIDGSCSGQAVYSIPVTVTGGPSISTTNTDPSCAGNDGQIVIAATGGATPYQYSIDNGVTFGSSATHTGLSAATYDIVVQDANGCQGTFSTTLNAGAGSLTVTTTDSDPSCANNDGQIVAAASGGATPYQYSIDGGALQSSDTFTSLAAGTYTILAQDNGGCQGTTTATLTIGASPITLSSAPTNPSCGSTDGTIVTTVTGGAAPYEFSSDNGATFTAGTSPYTFSMLGTGTYEIVVRDANSCEGTDQVTLVNPSAPSASATASNISCNGLTDGSVDVTWTGGTAPFDIDVNGSTTNGVTSTYTENGLGAGAVNITITDNNGCTATTSATITEPTAVTHSVTTNDASCGASNGSMTVTGANGVASYTYSDDNGASYQPSGDFTGLAAGTFNVIAMDANGCTSAMSVETIAGTGNVTASVSSTTNETCEDSNGAIVLSQTGGAGPYEYSIDGGSNFQSSASFSGLAAGTYNVVVKDASGCEGTTTSTLTNSGGVTPTITADQTICFGNNTVISATGGGAGSTYSWDNGLGTGSSQVVTPTTTTTYNVTITDASSCTGTASTTVTVETIPVVSIDPANSTICEGESITLTASGAQTYTWNTGATTADITVSPSNNTDYFVIGKNGDCSGTQVSTSVTVNASPDVFAGADQTTIALGGTVNFSNAGSGATSYSWDFGDGGSSTLNTPSHTFNSPGVHTVVLTGTLGNCSGEATLTINVGVTGVEEVSLEDAVTLFPNPNNGAFKLNIMLNQETDIEVSLFNMLGEQIESKEMQNITETTVDFDLINKADGFYFVNVKTKNGSVTKRISVIK